MRSPVSWLRGQALTLAPAVLLLPLSSGRMNPIGRMGGSGGVMSSRRASNTCLSRAQVSRLMTGVSVLCPSSSSPKAKSVR